MITCVSTGQDRVYITNSVGEATYDVIIVFSPSQADLVVNVIDKRYQLNQYKNAWYFTSQRSDATIIVRIVKTSNGNRKALRVLLNSPPDHYLSYKWIAAYQRLMFK